LYKAGVFFHKYRMDRLSSPYLPAKQSRRCALPFSAQISQHKRGD